MKNNQYLIASIIIGILLFSNLSIFAQSDNCDDDGYAEDTETFWDNIPVLSLSTPSAQTTLPSEVNNTTEIYFPQDATYGDPFYYSQEGNGSCAAVALVLYTFSYEINRVRDVSGQSDYNKYPPNFTWNFLNDASYTGASSFGQNLTIMQENGVANMVDWGNMDPTDYLRWMDGYEKYHNSHFNRIEGYSKIYHLENYTNLSTLKHWIADHNEGGSAVGGLAVFSSDGSCAPLVSLPAASAHSGDWALVNWSNGCKHAWTIVGYCDDIKYDFNEDGEYTLTEDINNDGILDVRDWEIGAFNVAGKGDASAGNNGLIWIPYKTVAEMEVSAFDDPGVIVIEVDDDYEPELEIKTTIDHSMRKFYGNRISWANKASQTEPTPGAHAEIDDFFWYSGGEVPLHGIDTDPIEVGFDFSYWFATDDFGKIFFRPKELGTYYYYGTVDEMSIIDYRWNEEFELACDQTNVTIPHGSYLNSVYVNYDLIPHESDIESNLTLDSDMISRFNPTVSNGATLTIDDEVNIDMYESELEITSTSTLDIGDDVTFWARDGICKITVDGSVSIGSGVVFKADAGAQLEIYLNNTGETLTITGATFDRAALISYIEDLTVSGADFDDGGLYGFNGDYTITGSSFDDSFLHISDAASANNKVTVTGSCSFSGENNTYAVKIDDYPEFVIENSTFTNNLYAIYVLYSGDGRYEGEITGNTIEGCDQAAIQLYYTEASVSENSIEGNGYGVKSLNGSSTGLSGGNTSTPAQFIHDNDYYEVYASNGAFPHHFSWNSIVDNDNTEPLVYYGGSTGTLYVSNNYWGGGYFNPSTDLYPPALYVYTPIWDPYSKSIGIAESLYDGAISKIEQQDYSAAKEDLKEVIQEHTGTIYAQAAVKKLFSMEAYSGGDYTSLKSYLANEPALEDGDILEKLTNFLINFCEIRQQNWQTAIDWFEDIIQDPETLEDSVFSIIDLGYTYLQMEKAGYKAAYSGTMTEHIPTSKEAYDEKRDYLLSLIPGDVLSKQMQQDIQQLKTGELLQNVPNPFKNSTQIWYKLEEEAHVMIRVYDYTGKQISEYQLGKVDQGHHHFNFIAQGLKPGIYFYSMEINGLVTDSKKMTVLK